ncbi:armadillo-type protein [Fimicolochytrium jonesii]|uniref:armadillo-type protein n=1 Tax=Fimicolochytrium jonesii TaxID=1396493 RepID=UPI0022FE3925|nr:armadillo-type protein [Fimicolochytrium jonesii]KAI8826947.1 armadillo-type protein [Fimicolochytrium jonesii]
MTEYHTANGPFPNLGRDSAHKHRHSRDRTEDLEALRWTLSSLPLDSHPSPWSIAKPNAERQASHQDGSLPTVTTDTSARSQEGPSASPSTVGKSLDQLPKSFERPTSLGSPDLLPASRYSAIVKAAVTIQRAFRRRKAQQLPQIAAAVKIQAAVRSHLTRKQILLQIHAQNAVLHRELAERNAFISRHAVELTMRNNMIEQFGKTIANLRRHVADTSSSYEIKLDVKEKQVEQLDRDLQTALRESNELKLSLEANAAEYAKMAWEMKDQSFHGSHISQYNGDIQRELESVRCELSETRSYRAADNIRLSLKNKEIQELRGQMKEVRRSLEAELATKNTEIDELRIRISRLQTQHGPPPLTPLDTDLPPRAPSSASAHNPPSGSVKSIWGSSDQHVHPFGLYSHDQMSSDTLYSNGSSKGSTPIIEHGPASFKSYNMNDNAVNGRGIWNPIACDLDFLNMSPAMVPMSAESLADIYGDAPHSRGGDGMGDAEDFSQYGQNALSTRLVPGAQEKNTSANFYYLVDKIVRTNDQPASLLLQQKLKTGGTDVKNMIFDAILGQAISLIKNRFGNFLMQRVLEFGTPQQVRVLGQTLRGNVLCLACDRFGCHVVQKALDTVDEDLKTLLISELFRCVRETITHRFACHVWQRIFQIKWSGEPPAVMHYLDAALKGQWHLIANDENGSLVVQCIFENCGQKEKGPILCEVLSRTVEVARGQWGNWVIQHILEHGAPVDRNYVMTILVHNFFPMAIDQYASKVVEKGLKLAPKREMYEMIETVLSPGGGGRPTILEMMNNQFANYVVQHILNLADPLQKDICVRLLLPHVSTLRNSKYGQRVAAIVEKHIRNSHQKFGLGATSAAAGLIPSSLTMGITASSHSIGLRG